MDELKKYVSIYLKENLEISKNENDKRNEKNEKLDLRLKFVISNFLKYLWNIKKDNLMHEKITKEEKNDLEKIKLKWLREKSYLFSNKTPEKFILEIAPEYDISTIFEKEDVCICWKCKYVFELKIRLSWLDNPLIERVILINPSDTFFDLHSYIQDIFGLDDIHLWTFRKMKLESEYEVDYDNNIFNEDIFGDNEEFIDYIEDNYFIDADDYWDNFTFSDINKRKEKYKKSGLIS